MKQEKQIASIGSKSRELLCHDWNNRKDVGTHCKCTESIRVMKKACKDIKQIFLDSRHQILFGNRKAEWHCTITMAYNVQVYCIRFLYQRRTQFHQGDLNLGSGQIFSPFLYICHCQIISLLWIKQTVHKSCPN